MTAKFYCIICCIKKFIVTMSVCPNKCICAHFMMPKCPHDCKCLECDEYQFPSQQYLKNGGEKLQSGDTSEFGKTQLFLDSDPVCLVIQQPKLCLVIQQPKQSQRAMKNAAKAKKAGGGGEK